MAQASTSPIDNVIDAAAQSSFQVLGLYRQAAKFAIEATGTWLETVGGVIPLGRVQSRLVQPWLRAGLEVWERAVAVQRELATDASDRLASLG